MKRFAALLLAFCLLVLALPASVFAADSIVGTDWAYVSHGLTFSPSANSTGVTYSFPAYLFTSDAVSFPLRAHETVNAGLKYSSLGDLNTDKFYLIPPDSYISISVTLDVTIDDNVFVADLLSDLPDAKIYFSAFGATRMSSQRDGTKWLSPTVTGLHSFSYSYSYSLYTQDARQILSLLLMDCQLSGNLYLLGNMTFKISQAQFFVRSMGSVVSSVEKNTNTVINNINNTIIQNNTQVNQQLSSIISVLNEIYGDTSSMNDLLSSLIEQINGMGEDLNSVLSYLQQINSSLSYLPRIYSKLDSIGLSDGAIKALSKAIADGISLKSADLSTVENYLSNCLNQINHLSDLVQLIADKLEVQCSSLSSILTELLNVGADVDLCVTYLTGINNSLGMLSATVEEMRGYVESSNQTLLDILSEMLTFDAAVKSTLKDILKNLVSQGADLSGMKSYLAAIKQNGAQANDLLRNLLDELQTVEAAHTETNERLAAIQDALDGFGVNLNQTMQQVMTDSDKQGLGGLISKIVNHLLSVIDFVGDLFGDIFTSIPSTISAFNDCNSFWRDFKTYVYTPHQLSGYTGQGGAGYENSNQSVKKLFARAEMYLGYPYVWGGSSPETSFDCSGFVCYALNRSGVYSIERTTAQGLYDTCTKVLEVDAKPGDLIFFTGTYNSGTPASHVGIYAGSGKMLHCGDPIQYESIDTPYWRSHLYGFGRLPYNDETVSVAFGAISDSSMFLQYTGGYAMDECVDMSSHGVTMYGYTFEDTIDFSYEAVGFPSHSVVVQYWDWDSGTWLEYAFPGLDTDTHQILLSASSFPDEYYNNCHALVVRILLIPVIGDPVCSPVIAVFPDDIAVPDIRVVWMDELSQIDFSIET